MLPSSGLRLDSSDYGIDHNYIVVILAVVMISSNWVRTRVRCGGCGPGPLETPWVDFYRELLILESSGVSMVALGYEH